MESQISQLITKTNNSNEQKNHLVKIRKSKSSDSSQSYKNLDINKEQKIKEEIKEKNKGKLETKKQLTSEKKDNQLIAVIRISGMVKVRKEIRETLNRLRLRRKYSCILIPASKSPLGMIEKVKFYVSYGPINKLTLEKLIKARAKSVEGNKKNIKIDSGEVSDSLFKGKKLTDFGLKPFIRLHPPRKGIKSKLQYPKGVLGNNGNDINKLIERML